MNDMISDSDNSDFNSEDEDEMIIGEIFPKKIPSLKRKIQEENSSELIILKSTDIDEIQESTFFNIPILENKKDQTFNATKLCEDHKKKFKKCFKQKEFRSLLEIVMRNNHKLDVIMTVIPDGKYEGTYLHKDFISYITGWISPILGMECHKGMFNHIDTLQREKNSFLENLNQEEKENLNQENLEEIERLRMKNQKYKEEEVILKKSLEDTSKALESTVLLAEYSSRILDSTKTQLKYMSKTLYSTTESLTSTRRALEVSEGFLKSK